MPNRLITTLKSSGHYNGALLFDDYKLSFHNDPREIFIAIIAFSFLCFASGLSTYNHFINDTLFHKIAGICCTLLVTSYVIYLVTKYRKAKKIHETEFTTSEIADVYLQQSRNKMEITFKLKDGSTQIFKTKKTAKSERLITLLNNSGVDI